MHWSCCHCFIKWSMFPERKKCVSFEVSRKFQMYKEKPVVWKSIFFLRPKISQKATKGLWFVSKEIDTNWFSAWDCVVTCERSTNVLGSNFLMPPNVVSNTPAWPNLTWPATWTFFILDPTYDDIEEKNNRWVLTETSAWIINKFSCLQDEYECLINGHIKITTRVL